MDLDEVVIEKLNEMVWVVVKTKARSEKKFAEYCGRRHVTHYLPLQPSIRTYGRRKVEYTVPMFPGYVFAQIKPNDKLTLLQSSQSAQVMIPDMRSEKLLIRELNDIRILIRGITQGELVIRPQLEIGKSVRVKSGVLKGLNGIVTRRNNKTRISVNVDMVGYSVSLDLHVTEVELEC